MREIQIDISTTGKVLDDIIFNVGDSAKTVEEETCFYNYFFLTATSVNFRSSTMILKYEEYSGWEPEAWLAICTKDTSNETYAIKIKVPKYYSSTNDVETRTVYVLGNIQTNSPLVSSSYNIRVRSNGCPEAEKFILSYETFDDDSEKILDDNKNINCNIEYIIGRNIDFFNGGDEANMLNIAARKTWDEYDFNWDSYISGVSTYGQYEIEDYPCTGVSHNARQYKKSSKVALPSGFFKTSGNSFNELSYNPIYNEYIDVDDSPVYRVDLVFDEPLEAIGYHTFYLGKHFNSADVPDLGEDDYIGYEDEDGDYHYFPGDTGTSINENIFFDGKLNSTYIEQKNIDGYVENDGAKWDSYFSSQINENEYLFEESDNIKGVKTGKYLKFIGNQAFKKLRNLEYIDFEGSPLERIGMYAFEGCESLQTIDIPDTVTLIGEGAFKRSYIYEITIPSGLSEIEAETFRLCKNLVEVDFSNCTSLYKICKDAFRGCWNITGLTFPSTLRHIERMAFSECDSIENVTFNSGLEYIGYRAFDKCHSITNLTITAGRVGDRAFNKCSSLTSVTFTNSVKYIEDFAFHRAPLSSITFSDGLLSIGDEAFCGSHAHIVEVPNSVTSIGVRAFNGVDFVVYTGDATGAPWGADYAAAVIDNHIGYGDTAKTTIVGCEDKSITNVTIIGSVRTIEDKAFDGCNSLTAITIPTGVTSIGNYAFSGCTSLSSLTMQNGLNSIGKYAFAGCRAITSVSIPNSVGGEYIGEGAFSYCTGIITLSLSENLTAISSYAFIGCGSLTSVTIPSNVTNIGFGAFYGCSSITTIRYGGTAEKWINNVTRGDNWSFGITGTSVVICSGGEEAPLNP